MSVKTSSYEIDLLKDIKAYLRTISCNTATAPTADFDKTVLCDINTGAKIVLVTSYSAIGVPTTNAFNLNGTPYAGNITTDLQECEPSLESDGQQICVSGNSQLIQWVVKSGGQPTGTVYYTNLSGVIVAAPTAGTFTFGDCIQSSIYQRCLCDDVNGDQSLIVNYIEFYRYDPVTNAITVIGTWREDLSATYIPVNPIDCNLIGNTVLLVQQREELTGIFVWNRPANQIQSITLKVRATGPTNPTVRDNANRVTNLYLGDVETWSTLDDTNAAGWLTGGFTITSIDPKTIITILYTELV